MKRVIPKTKLLIIAVLTLCLLITPVKIHASQQKVMRVGCVDIENFLVLNKDGSASGYGAEYLKEIAKYTGWKYEYVKGTWSDCMAWLKQGKIDLLLPAERSDERSKDYLFSKKECCLDYAALIGRKSDDNYFFQDYKAYHNMRVGMIRENYLNEIFHKYAKEHGFTYKPIYYKNGAYLSTALERNEVDAIVTGSMSYESNQKLLDKIAYMPAYFITSRDNPKLMKQLDSAMNQIILSNPYYNAGLYDKYYASTERQSTGLTKAEAAYIKRSPKITVLFETDDYPLEWYDQKTNTCKGLYVDLLKLVQEESGLNLQFIPNTSEKSAWQAVEDGDADVLASACSISSYDLSFTASFYDCDYSLVGKKSQTYDLSTPISVAIPEKLQGVKSLIQQEYPHWILLTYDTTDHCLDAVSQGRAQLACVSSLTQSDLLDSANVVVLEIDALSVPVSLGISKKSDPLLASVLSKTVLKIEPQQLDSCIINSITTIKSERTLSSFVRENLAGFLMAIILFLIIISACIFSFYRAHMQKKQNQMLQQKTRELEEAAAIQEKLRLRAQTDLLTNLKNKDTTEQICKEYLECHPQGGYTLFILDLDHFKSVNDIHGHLSGDRILIQFAQILNDTAKQGDIVGRIGGDEFLMFLAHSSSEADVQPYIDMIYRKLEAPLHQMPEILVSCSIGGIINTSRDLLFSELFTLADQCLYEAKARGRNQSCLKTI